MMADACKNEGCVRRTDQRLCAQKNEYDERLRIQKEEDEERLRVQKDEYEERLRVQKEEYEDRLRVQKEEDEKEALATLESYYHGYYPLPLYDFPLEIIALIADFVYDVDDLARMSLVCRRLHNGVLLSRQWIMIEEIVAATAGNVKEQKEYLHDRSLWAHYACAKGLLRCLRTLNLTRRDVTSGTLARGRQAMWIIALRHGQLDIFKYLHTTYALTALDLLNSMGYAVRHPPVLEYLRTGMGMAVPRVLLDAAAFYLDALKYCHSERSIGFTAETVRDLDFGPLYVAGFFTPGTDDCTSTTCNVCSRCARERLVYLRDEYGVTSEDARRAIVDSFDNETELIRSVFGIDEDEG
eukprot:TRINITY_DN2457_c0_g1_i4.p1 TRINITY_DN2457_c0_g1~~TRINITY_DN2457_c0_g1_i4.p1  ORF type:complete len:354 (+),score=78.91 TRINITY_DN2457_c0_g1_i4:166-1227(+)